VCKTLLPFLIRRVAVPRAAARDELSNHALVFAAFLDFKRIAAIYHSEVTSMNNCTYESLP
jgi:hypothetical protein